MAITPEEIEFAKEVFRQVPNVTAKKMFGGLSLYSDGVIFAIIGPSEELMVKARDDLAAELADLGSTQFVYHGQKDKVTTMPYWTLPDSALDDPDEAFDWARRSLAQNA